MMTKHNDPRIRLFLDSGAFSAWTNRKTVNLRDYIKFLQDCEPFLWKYVNLDVIPGSTDHPRTREETAEAAQQSYRNLQIMKDAGFRPLPVFHHGENFSWLERMLKDGEDYIGISSAKNLPQLVQRRWLDQLFSILTDRQGRPLVRVHGFGVGHVSLLRRYPFYSVDSAGWTIAAVNGKIYVPPYANGRPDYLGDPTFVTVTGKVQKSRYSQRRQLANCHYYSVDARRAVHRFLEEEVGVNLGMARDSASVRSRALAVYYERVAEAIEGVRFHYRLSPVLGEGKRVHDLLKRRGPVEIDRLRFVFSTPYDRSSCATLLAAGARHHLLSYWELRRRPQVLRAYALHGDPRPSR